MTNMLSSMFGLDGRIAVVTGGAGLLGKEHCHALAAAGATVFVADISEAASKVAADEINASGHSGLAVGAELDVTSEASVAALAERITGSHGVVSILINNAAIDPKVRADAIVETSRLEHFPLDQWHFQIGVGLTGAFVCAREFGSRMAAADGGVILNIASDLAVFAPDQRLYRRDDLPDNRQPVKPVTYPVIKTALLGLTRYLATYWADRNVRCNALSPGGVYNGQSDEFVRRLSNLIPLGRMAGRSEYQAAVLFLCSDASSYMTGQNVVMDGGRSVW